MDEHKPRTSAPLIVVIGDIFIDQIVFHREYRRTPDGTIVIPSAKSRRVQTARQSTPGGAGAVALMAHTLGARVALGGIGNNRLLKLIERNTPFRSDFVVSLTGEGMAYSVPIKTRHIVGPKTVLRIDEETIIPICEYRMQQILTGLRGNGTPDALILSDYSKGLLHERSLRMIRREFPGVPTFVDPAADKVDWSVYGGELAAICPNRHEIGAQRPCEARHLADASVLIEKRDVGGLVLWERDCEPYGFPSTVSETSRDAEDMVVDTVGAGDMVIAALTVARARGESWRDACEFANAAAGEKCTHFGAVPVSPEAVERRMRRCCLRNA